MHTRRSYLILLGFIVAALVGVGMMAVPGSPGERKATLGLDLQGGLEVVLKAVPPKGVKVTNEGLNRSVEIMRNRVDKLGASEPDVRKQDPDQIVIQLAGIHDTKRATEIIGKTAQLELYDLEADLTGPSTSQGFPIASVSLYNLLAKVQAKAKIGTPTAYYLFDSKKLRLAGPEETRQRLFNAQRPTVPKGGKVLAVPEKMIVITCDQSAVVCPGVSEFPPTRPYFYLFKRDLAKGIPEMTGKDLKLSGTRQDFDPQTGEAIVLLDFTGAGRKKFHDITRAEAVRGKLIAARTGNPDSSLQHFGIVLDDEIVSFPSIDFRQYPDGIDPTNGAQITGIRSVTEAKNLALVLQTGALPYEYQTLSQTDVSATLGKDSLRQAKKAALIGLLIVALFLLVLYRFLGVVAVAGLAIYSAFFYGIVLLMNGFITLTLPGFAGLILTIGVAADANVVIFERIKEEVRAGKSVRAAISAGYSKGFHTIIDANVVTAITALVLFAVATAGVKGFALMLLVGTVISLLTAVAATRALLGLLAGFSWFDNPRFMGAAAQQRGRWLQIDFMKRRYLWFAISGAIMAIGLVSLGVRGLNLGIDFKGGTQVTFRTPQPVAIEKVRQEAARIGKGGAIVQGRGKQTGSDSYTSFQIRTKSLTPAQGAQLRDDLEQRLHVVSYGAKNVSSSFGRQIAKLAIIAILVSLLLIVLYIALRFDFKFAGPVIVALIHDIAITVGVYALTAREVSTATVAAVLTVLGYSIYDTIIIFDRIRENVPLMRRASFATIANVSLWETIRRSLATTLITLLPVTALLLFGGETLKDFAFALLVGIGSGAYSSIFIAAPLLTIWKEREPEFRHRIESEHLDKGVGGAGLEGTDEPEDGGQPSRRRTLRPSRAPGVPVLDPGPGPMALPIDGPSLPPAPGPGDAAPPLAGSADAKREQRRQRRRGGRPHGRAR